MFPRLCVSILTTGYLGVQSEISAYSPVPLSGADKSLIDMRIGEVIDRPLRLNQHGLAYFIQSTGNTKVVLKKHHPLEGVTVMNESVGVMHALHIKPTVEDRLNVHLTFSLEITNQDAEMVKLAVVKS